MLTIDPNVKRFAQKFILKREWCGIPEFEKKAIPHRCPWQNGDHKEVQIGHSSELSMYLKHTWYRQKFFFQKYTLLSHIKKAS